MSNVSIVQPALLSKINERQVLRVLRANGALSRAEVARYSGITAPTASKAVESLLRAGLLEEEDAIEGTRGRPAKKLRLATETAQVLGFVIDADQCRLVSSGLDGAINEERTRWFPTPNSYDELIDIAARHASELMERAQTTTFGMGISVPGLVDYRQNMAILSPNVPMTNMHSPGKDLSERLGIECIMMQEEHALCLAERFFGEARNLDDFAMLDVSTGVGLGVMSGGRLLTGHSGFAGEVGHITVELDGRLCGCGNRGCLETVASDTALLWSISQRIGRKVDIDEALTMVERGELSPGDDLAKACRYLAIGIAAVINIFNPSTLFIHGRMFEIDHNLFHHLIEETRRRALSPSCADCHIIQAHGSKRLGAVAAIIEHLTDSMVPAEVADTVLSYNAVGALKRSIG